jgi:hypothetical protein
VLALGRDAVGVEDQVIFTVVCGLESSAWVYMDEPARGHVLARWWFTEVHRQGPGEDNERFLLESVLVAASLGTGFVAPNVCAAASEAGQLAQFGHVSGWFRGLVRARRPRQLPGANHVIGHDRQFM